MFNKNTKCDNILDMNDNEKLFFAFVCLFRSNDGSMMIGEAFMLMVRLGYSEKQLLYYIDKWIIKFDIADSGVSDWCGWVYEDKLTGRYKQIYDNPRKIINNHLHWWLHEHLPNW